MLDQSNAETGKVKSEDFKTPAMCDYTTGETEETKEEVHYNILQNPVTVYCDDLALLRFLAGVKTKNYYDLNSLERKQLRETFSIPFPANNIFTTSTYMAEYYNLTETFTPTSIAKLYNETKSSILSCKATCHYKLRATMSQLLGYERNKIKLKIKSSIDAREKNRLFDRLKNVRKFTDKIKDYETELTIGEAFTLTANACKVLAISGDNMRIKLLEDNSYVIKLMLVKFKVERELDRLFGLERGLRLCSLFGYPGTTPTRGDMIGLVFGNYKVIRPKRSKSYCDNLQVDNTTTLTLQCRCDKQSTTKAGWYDIQRGRFLSCGCWGNKTVTDTWLLTMQAAQHNRFVKKRADKHRPHIDWRFWREETFQEFVGLPWCSGLDLSRLDDARDDYEPGLCFWEAASENRRRGARTRKQRQRDKKKALELVQDAADFNAGRGPSLRKDSEENQIDKAKELSNVTQNAAVPDDEAEVDFDL